MTTFRSIQTRRNVIREDLKLCKERRERRHLQNDRNIYIYIPPHSASYNIAATTTCVSRVSVLVGHRKRLPPVQVTVATTTCASRVSVLVGHRKRPPVQVTVAPDQHTHHSHHHMCLKVNAHDAIELRVHGKKFNGMPLGKLQLLAAACTPMAAVQVLTGCNLRWWSFSSAIERIYFQAHVVV